MLEPKWLRTLPRNEEMILMMMMVDMVICDDDGEW